ncbi:putative ABC transport system ATP-binding protein [Antricoccus suffuscus]|uniref:Putative ABC transport system ATP-binding protein n=1 Tax=Antricoccus suffuscus TaxID=1629062 RepID=A0A2T0ZXX2_9ACTN|nr:ATP-binding cassette domain-containing protein [Antricoccus suffuscus]PRZ41134.1 putative ABC transport system ATP-binding protein [Antricoccus suffuscus]
MNPGNAQSPVPTGAVFRARGLVKSYQRGADTVTALDRVDLQLEYGEVVALVGPSGSGKSTLLNVLCGWERPDAGTLDWDDDLGGARADRMRWDQLAVVPQSLALLAELQGAENVLLPARTRKQIAQWTQPAGDLMERFGIDQLAKRLPDQMSLGEQQRCSVARALLLSPNLLLADEPTAHQDSGWTEVLFTAMRDLAAHHGACLIATHNPATWQYADRIVSMADGRLTEGAPADHI